MIRSESEVAGVQAPEAAGGWPLVGHLPSFQSDLVGFLHRGLQAHGDLFRFRLGPREVLLFCGPQAHDFFFGPADDQLDPKAVYEFTVPIFGRGVAYDVAPEIMSEQLGFVYPALQGGSMQRFTRIMHEEISLFADSLGDEGEIDLPSALNQLTVKIASHCLIGAEVRARVDQGFAADYHDLEKGINTIGFFFPKLPTSAHRSRDRARKRIAKLIGEVLDERRRSARAPDDFMQALMAARYKSGRALEDEEIIGILLTLLFAGQHTSAVLATWTGLELAGAPSYLQRVRQEIHEVYRDNAEFGLGTLKSQTLLEYSVRECERLHPPLILLVRKVMADLQYGGCLVPEGALAMVAPVAAHRLAEIFPHPDQFNPDRFGPPDFEGKQYRHALIGFGGGKHQCMGKHFAYVQLKSIWTILLNRFDFSLDTPVPAPNYGSWVTGPKEPCRLRYRRRSDARPV